MARLREHTQDCVPLRYGNHYTEEPILHSRALMDGQLLLLKGDY